MSGRNWELKEIQMGLSSTVDENPNLLFYPEIWTFDGEVLFSTQMGWEKCKIRNIWRTEKLFSTMLLE